MPQCEWYPDGQTLCQNEATRKALIIDTGCDCATCLSEPHTIWICDRCAELAPAHWEKLGVVARF